jgi:hypothetical protein
MSPPSSELKNKPSKYQYEAASKQSKFAFFGLLFNPENGGDIYLRNVG